MAKIKKAIVLILAISAILILTNNTFASTIQPRNSNGNGTGNEAGNTSENTPSNNASSNTPANNTNNNNTNNNTSGNTSNSLIGGTNITNSTPINTTNTTQNIPHTGIDTMYLNFALIILLALVLGIFSLVQYNKIIKKEDE